MTPDDVRFRRATAADAGEILTLQRAAFVREARLYHEPDLPPLVETLDEITAAIRSASVLVGLLGVRVVASGRVSVRDGVGHVGRLAVVPDLQGQGIGRRLLAELEAGCDPSVGAFELFTGSRAEPNLQLYRSAGYQDLRTEVVSPSISLIHLRKQRVPGRTDPRPAPAGHPAARDLVGSWRLERWESVADDGSLGRPFGERPEGILVYDADGTMITTIAPADRPPIGSPDPLRGGPDAERVRTAETFIAYSGRYAYDGTDVTHTVTMSLYPNWVGTRQVRHVRLSDDGDALELSTDPFTLAGRRSIQRLTWIRIRPDG